MEINSLAGYFLVITDVVFFFLVGEGGREEGRREGERWKHSVQFVGNFFELTVRHITFKRLKVGHRVRCSVLYTVFVGEKRREEKRREEKRREENGERRREGEEREAPPCSCPARLRV